MSASLPAATPTSPTTLPQGAVRLHDWGVIRAQGAEAAKFLHGQLTQDVEHLQEGQVKLAGYCSAKGRLLASFVMWRGGPEEVLLACSADLLPAVLKRLSMFVLRAKCKLSDASAELPLWGLAGAAAAAPAATAGVNRCRCRTLRWRAARRPRLVGGRAEAARARRPGAGHRRLALAGSAQRRGAHRRRHVRAIRAADGEPGTGGRRELPEGLLPRAGNRRAQPVPRHAETPRLCAAQRRAAAARPGGFPGRANPNNRPAWWRWPAAGPGSTPAWWS